MAPSKLMGGNLLHSQAPLSFLFVCRDMARWHLETEQAEKALESAQHVVFPSPRKAMSSSSVSGALGSDCSLPGARESFLFVLPPRLPSLSFPQVGLASDRSCFEMNLSSSSPPSSPPPQVARIFWLLSVTWGLC